SQSFLNSLAEEFKETVDVKVGSILSYASDSLTLHDKSTIKFDRCFLGLGACNNSIAPAIGSRTVSGQYAFCDVDLGNDSFGHSKGPHNLLYNAGLKQLMIGSLDDKDDSQGLPLVAPRSNALKEMLNGFEIELPPNPNWQIKCGVRHKGQKR